MFSQFRYSTELYCFTFKLIIFFVVCRRFSFDITDQLTGGEELVVVQVSVTPLHNPVIFPWTRTEAEILKNLRLYKTHLPIFLFLKIAEGRF